MDSSGDKVFKCDLCEFKSTWKCSLKRHLETVHVSDRPHVCLECDSRFKTKVKLSQHRRCIHGPGRFQCSKCSVWFSEYSRLRVHWRMAHHHEKTHECRLCKKKFYERSALQFHLKRIHYAIKDEKCLVCEKMFSRRGDMYRHVRMVHNIGNKKAFPCTICAYKTTEASLLRRHQLRMHRPEVLQVGQRKKKQPTYVKGGFKMFKCGACNYKSAYKQNVSRHFRMHHPEAREEMIQVEAMKMLQSA